MRTKLYRMWVRFCKAPEKWRAMANQVWVDPKTNEQYTNYDMACGKAPNAICRGVIYFNSKFINGLCIDDRSPEYHAWNAFMTAKDSIKDILIFIMKKFNIFKEYLPATVIVLDINNLKPKDAIKTISDNAYDINNEFINDLKRALITDIDFRKRHYATN